MFSLGAVEYGTYTNNSLGKLAGGKINYFMGRQAEVLYQVALLVKTVPTEIDLDASLN